MIRTLHILNCLHRRGAETFAVQMIDRLNRDRFSPYIWTARTVGHSGALAPERTPVLSNGHHSTAQAIRDLYRQLRMIRPHIVQCHGGAPLNFALAAKPFWQSGAYVYNKIGSIHPYLDSPVKRRIYGMVFERVDAIVAVGEEIRRELEETFHLRRPRLVTISNGRSVRPFLAVTPETISRKRLELGLAPQHLCLMQVGITAEKDPQTTLRVFARLATTHANLRLVFVGEGPLADALRRESAARDMSGLVRVLGPRPDVPALLSAADLVILPSLSEGLPGVLIEAGMAGRPAVAYDVGSVRSVLADRDTGFLVSPGDRATLISRLDRLIRDPELRVRMGDQARQRCRSTFAIEASVEKYQVLFADLVRSRKAA